MPVKPENPFADRRFHQPGFTPKQVKVQKARKHKRIRAKIPKVEKELQDAKLELLNVNTKVKRRQELLEMMSKAPSVAAQRKILFQMFEEADYNPIQTLIDHATDPATPVRERIALAKELAAYYQPKPKSVEVQGHLSGGSGVTINVVDFGKASQAVLRADHAQTLPDTNDEPDDEAYAEFLSPEELHQRSAVEQATPTSDETPDE